MGSTHMYNRDNGKQAVKKPLYNWLVLYMAINMKQRPSWRIIVSLMSIIYKQKTNLLKSVLKWVF